MGADQSKSAVKNIKPLLSSRMQQHAEVDPLVRQTFDEAMVDFHSCKRHTKLAPRYIKKL